MYYSFWSILINDYALKTRSLHIQIGGKICEFISGKGMNEHNSYYMFYIFYTYIRYQWYHLNGILCLFIPFFEINYLF